MSAAILFLVLQGSGALACCETSCFLFPLQSFEMPLRWTSQWKSSIGNHAPPTKLTITERSPTGDRMMFRRPSRSKFHAKRKQTTSRRLAIEECEAKRMLTTFVVSSDLDTGASGELRWAVDQANANPGTDTIVFSPDVLNINLTMGEIAITDHLRSVNRRRIRCRLRLTLAMRRASFALPIAIHSTRSTSISHMLF